MSFLNSMDPKDLCAPYNPDDNLSVEECQDIIKSIHSNSDKSMPNTIINNINNNNTSSITRAPRTPQLPIITEAPSGYNTLIHLNKTNPSSTHSLPIITEAPSRYNTLIHLNKTNQHSTPKLRIITEAPIRYNTLNGISVPKNTINYTIYNKYGYDNHDNNNRNNNNRINNDNKNQENVIDLDTVDNIPITINDSGTLPKYKYYICPFIGFNLSNDLFYQCTLGSCTQCSKAWMNPLRSIKRMFNCFPADKHNKIDKCDECICCCIPCICCLETCITCFILICTLETPHNNNAN